jgi:hypothetical protein
MLVLLSPINPPLSKEELKSDKLLEEEESSASPAEFRVTTRAGGHPSATNVGILENGATAEEAESQGSTDMRPTGVGAAV